MSEQVIADVSRDGSVLFSGVPVELHFSVEMELNSYGGVTPYYRYLCIVYQLIAVNQNDYLVNVRRIDPLTGQLIAFVDASGAPNNPQVTSKPERFADHIEFMADDRRTTGFS